MSDRKPADKTWYLVWSGGARSPWLFWWCEIKGMWVDQYDQTHEHTEAVQWASVSEARAARDLLEACKAAEPVLNECEADHALDLVRAAIAKAEGGAA